jgi:hypothetical protein
MVSFTPVAVALLGLASYPGVAAFAPKKSGGFGLASPLKMVRILSLSVPHFRPSVRVEVNSRRQLEGSSRLDENKS